MLRSSEQKIDGEDPINVPHIVHRAPVLIQQDNRSAIAFTHNPVSMAAMKGNLIRMSGVRDALELGTVLSSFYENTCALSL